MKTEPVGTITVEGTEEEVVTVAAVVVMVGVVVVMGLPVVTALPAAIVAVMEVEDMAVAMVVVVMVVVMEVAMATTRLLPGPVVDMETARMVAVVEVTGALLDRTVTTAVIAVVEATVDARERESVRKRERVNRKEI